MSYALDDRVRTGTDATVAHHNAFQCALLLRALPEALFDGAGRQQAEHENRLALANAMASVLRLKILLRIPVRVEDHHRVGRRQVQPQSAGARRQQKDKNARVIVKPINMLLPLLPPHRAVQPAVAIASPRHVALQNVQHLRHLRKQQHLVATGRPR